MRWLLPWIAALVVAGGVAWAVSAMMGEEPMQVRSVAVDEGGQVLEVTYLGPPPECDAPTRVIIEESAQTVEISAWAARAEDGECPAIARLLTTRVELDNPLADRTVIDGRNGQPVQVDGP